MSPSCLQDLRDCGVTPDRPSKLSLMPAMRGNPTCARLSPEPNPSQEQREHRACTGRQNAANSKEGEEMEAQEFLICVVEETQIPGDQKELEMPGQ